MNRPRKFLCVIASVLVLVSVITYGIIRFLRTVDFHDNPALLIGITETGTVILETYDGKLIGRLRHVQWHESQDFYAEVSDVIGIAQQDQVAFSHHQDGDLTIWYHHDVSVMSLNDTINEIRSKYTHNLPAQDQ